MRTRSCWIPGAAAASGRCAVRLEVCDTRELTKSLASCSLVPPVDSFSKQEEGNSEEDRVAPRSERQRPYPTAQQIPGYSSRARIVSSGYL